MALPCAAEIELKEGGISLSWEDVDVTDNEGLIQELLEFWSRQTPADIRSRFFSGPIPIRIIEERYRHAFRFTRFAFVLRDKEQLIGFYLGTVDPRRPDWVNTSVEIDREYRRLGLSMKAHQKAYELALSNGFCGITGEILVENSASIGAIRKFCQDKPHYFCQKSDVVYYYVGEGVTEIYHLDLLE